jgi:hypothetical protein
MAARSKPLKGYKRLPGHKYRTPRGKIITEYEYRSRKARKSGFRNYTQQRKLRESQGFQAMRFKALSNDPTANLAAGSMLEAEIVAFLRHREQSGASFDTPQEGYRPFPGPDGWPARPGTGAMVGEPGGRFADLLAALGLPDWWQWRYWYSEIKIA